MCILLSKTWPSAHTCAPLLLVVPQQCVEVLQRGQHDGAAHEGAPGQRVTRREEAAVTHQQQVALGTRDGHIQPAQSQGASHCTPHAVVPSERMGHQFYAERTSFKVASILGLVLTCWESRGSRAPVSECTSRRSPPARRPERRRLWTL